MRSALLLSVLIATITIPLLSSRTPKSKRGLRWTILGMAIFIVIWGYTVKNYYWRFE